MKPSLSLIVYCVFFLFIGNSVWNLLKMFKTPTCKNDGKCYTSFLNTKPNLDLMIYTSDNSKSYEHNLIFSAHKFNYEEPFEKEIPVNLSRTVRNNGTLYIHTVIFPSEHNRKRLSLQDAVQIPAMTYLPGKLTKFAIPKSYAFNLLNDETKVQSVNPISHLKNRYAITMCTEDLSMSYSSIPVELVQLLRVNEASQFLPIVYNDFMQTRMKDLVEITKDMKNTTFQFIYNPTSVGKLRFILQIEAVLKEFLNLGFTEKDLDEIKGILVDTNIYLLCATVVIGSIHLLLDFLSFKNDISFWKRNRSMAGLSRRTVLWRAFSQVIVFLYLLDEGTSLLVLIPAGIGTIIEFWKVAKVLRVSVSWKGLKMREREESKEEMETRRYDDECMKYLSYFLYPLCICAAIYSLFYQPHKSWYSWTISSLVNAVYAFGFLFMLPQLFVNYRLKSVAALPWRTFTYKAFNTFIDDVFAFIITMPMAHRVACFRDDVVFLIYLYQRWLYPVDKKRVDVAESIEDVGEVEEKKEK